MNLVDAMRKGCEATAPLKGDYLHLTDALGLQACALGAAWLSIGHTITEFKNPVTLAHDLKTRWPELGEKIGVCPVQNPCTAITQNDPQFVESMTLLDIIVHVVDDHDWSRDQAISWVESHLAAK